MVEAFASAPLALGTLNSHSGRFYLVAFTSSAELSPCCEPLMFKRHQYTQEPFSPEKLVNQIGGRNTGGGQERKHPSGCCLHCKNASVPRDRPQLPSVQAREGRELGMICALTAPPVQFPGCSWENPMAVTVVAKHCLGAHLRQQGLGLIQNF